MRRNGTAGRARGRLATTALVIVVVASGLVAGTGPAASRPAGPARGGTGALPRAQTADSVTAPFSYCSQIPTLPGVIGPFQSSVYAAGYANSAKLDGSEPVGPALLLSGPGDGLYIDIRPFGPLQPGGPTYRLCQLARLHLDDNGQPAFPPTTATFLGFGFMPVTAAVQLTQAGLTSPPPVMEVAYTEVDNGLYTVVTTAQLNLQVLSAKVNGVPLDVGADCHTAAPLYTPDSQLPADMQVDPGNDLVVSYGGDAPTGEPQPPFGNISVGGAMASEVTIPSFTGCNGLDPLIDASVSGQDNYVNLVAGPLCAVGNLPCTSDDLPVTEPLWTVTNGGTYTGGGPVSFTGAPFSGPVTTITCTGSSIAGTLPDAAGPPRGAAGTFRWTGFTGCTGPQGSTWQVSQQGTAVLSFQTYAGGTSEGTVSGLSLAFTGTLSNGSTCQASLTEPRDFLQASYKVPKLTLSGDYLAASPGTPACPASVFAATSSVASPNWAPQASYGFSPDTITITSP